MPPWTRPSRAQVEAEAHANVDETGWKEAGERRCLWVAVTALCTFFVVAKNQSASMPSTLLGETIWSEPEQIRLHTMGHQKLAEILRRPIPWTDDRLREALRADPTARIVVESRFVRLAPRNGYSKSLSRSTGESIGDPSRSTRMSRR